MTGRPAGTGGAAVPTGLWHVTVTFGGDPQDVDDVRAALERLRAERPFLLNGRYADDRVELSYWDEAEDCDDACAIALRLWADHRRTSGLPPWHVRGVAVLARDEYLRTAPPLSVEPGSLAPF